MSTRGEDAHAELTGRILAFWFGDDDAPREAWFVADPAFDHSIREAFADATTAALAGSLDDMADGPEGALALILLLDQFPRNLHRGSADAFAGDARARAIAERTIDSGWDAALAPVRRQFVYLPFQHSENLDDQRRSVALYAELAFDDGLEWAERHLTVIERFGRFPHRNAALGRALTPEEEAFLAENPHGF